MLPYIAFTSEAENNQGEKKNTEILSHASKFPKVVAAKDLTLDHFESLPRTVVINSMAHSSLKSANNESTASNSKEIVA